MLSAFVLQLGTAEVGDLNSKVQPLSGVSWQRRMLAGDNYDVQMAERDFEARQECLPRYLPSTKPPSRYLGIIRPKTITTLVSHY